MYLAGDAGGQQGGTSAIWDTLAARRWWWPDLFFTLEAAEAAVSQALALEPQQGAEDTPAAGAELAAKAAVAAFMFEARGAAPCNPHQPGAGFAERIMHLCRQHDSLAHVADEVGPGSPQFHRSQYFASHS